MEDNIQFEIFIKPSHKKYYSSDSTWGIYSATLEDNSPNQEIIMEVDEMFREVSIVGSMPELEIGNTYIATVEEKTHKVYGKQYEVKTIYKKPYTTRDEQVMFFSTLLTSKQMQTILEAYPTGNLVEMFKEDKIDVSILKGIGDKTLNNIKEKIVENEKYQTAIVELTGKFGIPYKSVKRLSDKYGSPDTLLQKINENPYILTEVDGFGFKTVDEIALKMGVDKKSKNRIKSCIIYLLEVNGEEGHSWVKRTKLISEAIKLLKIKIADIEEILNDIDTSDKYIAGKKRVYLVKYLKYELTIALHIKRLLSEKVEYNISNIEEAIKEVEDAQGFEFTDEQIKAIHFAIKYNVLVVNGKAGTGKTSVIKGIVGVLNKVEGLEYGACALSGKASQRIQESTGLDASTMHRILGYNPNTGWAFDEFNQLGQDVLLLDEASMVNTMLFSKLVSAIKNCAKFIITGDIAQLEPIGVGNVLVDLLKSELVPKVELTIVHRQAQRSGILSCANRVREGKRFISECKTQRLGELKDLYMYPYNDKEKVLQTTLAIAKKYDGDIMDFQVLAPMKNRGDLSTKNLNNELQKIFNQDPEWVDKKRKLERKDCTFLEGDKVIINGNNYDKDCFNGTMGVIEHIDSEGEKGEIIIDFEGVGRLLFTKSEMNQIDLGYAITIHKSQGSQWKYVLLALDYASYVLLNRQSTYTAMTRAKDGLFMVVELKALQYSIDTDKSSERNTFLQELLVE